MDSEALTKTENEYLVEMQEREKKLVDALKQVATASSQSVDGYLLTLARTTLKELGIKF